MSKFCPLTIRKAAAEQAVRGGRVLKFCGGRAWLVGIGLAVGLMLLAAAMSAPRAYAQVGLQTQFSAAQAQVCSTYATKIREGLASSLEQFYYAQNCHFVPPGFRLCQGDYALCAASTCSTTQTMIKVNSPLGGFKYFPQADCQCPVFHGLALADVTGGNMQGSCAPPAPPLPGPTPIWSLFSMQAEIPQAPTWALAPANPQICSAALNQGDQSVNCFSFACDTEKVINGVPVVTCHCAEGESFDAEQVPANTAFGIQSAQTVPGICFEHPISLPFTLELEVE